MYVSQTSYVADMCSYARKRTYFRVLIKSSTHVIQIKASANEKGIAAGQDPTLAVLFSFLCGSNIYNL